MSMMLIKQFVKPEHTALQGCAYKFICHVRRLPCSCDGGNLDLLIVRTSGSLLPHVAMFASTNIAAGSELTFAYGPPSGGSLRASARHCLCQTPACLGFLPSSDNL